MTIEYPAPLMFIGGAWRKGGDGICGVVTNPATGETLAEVPRASIKDLDEALESARMAFHSWRRVPAVDRAALLRRAAELLRQRAPVLGRLMALEQGKTLAEAEGEYIGSAEAFDWYAAEALRANGRVIPARIHGARQLVIPEPIGPVAAFTPWNYPANLPARKIGGAIAAGCSVVIKPSEETPASTMGVIHALIDAGMPSGLVNLVFGVPSEVSTHLIRSEVIRKITFTGSTPVGRQLAILAGEGTKPCTLELGGHAPVVVFDDADLDKTVAACALGKIRNTGQVCTSPTRFIVQDGIHDAFVTRFAEAMSRVTVGPGLDTANQMGALANSRRMDAMEDFVTDASRQGARVVTGGNRAHNAGYFWWPTVIADTPTSAKAMNVEPFGPLALVTRFSKFEDGLAEANRLPFGLAAYAFTQSSTTAVAVGEELQSGGVGINSFAVAQIEAPFGGVKHSGYGNEGGHEGLEAFMHPKYIHHAP